MPLRLSLSDTNFHMTEVIRNSTMQQPLLSRKLRHRTGPGLLRLKLCREHLPDALGAVGKLNRCRQPLPFVFTPGQDPAGLAAGLGQRSFEFGHQLLAGRFRALRGARAVDPRGSGFGCLGRLWGLWERLWASTDASQGLSFRYGLRVAGFWNLGTHCADPEALATPARLWGAGREGWPGIRAGQRHDSPQEARVPLRLTRIPTPASLSLGLSLDVVTSTADRLQFISFRPVMPAGNTATGEVHDVVDLFSLESATGVRQLTRVVVAA